MGNARYRVEGVLGTGGAGCVSRAFDLFADRTVALKRLATDKLATRHDRERAQALFEREYHVLAQLAHPKIIEVYDYAVDDDGPYYTMEWLRGTSLRRETPMPVGRACALLRDVTSSLAILHSRRLVHRDVTPHNIYCSDDGTAKLIDFGAMSPMGVPKVVVGTPPFMAPECVEFRAVDGRTDLFSLGACLYYALTGRHAYAARTIRDLPEVWRGPLVWPSRLAPGIPEPLDRLILELLSLKPAGRPASAAEVFERLTTIAGLDRGEPPAVARAYLASPAIAGRRKELGSLLRKSLRAARGKGSSVVITGPAGIGRSRLLAATVLEAKLSGFTVLHAAHAEARAIPFGAIRSMVRALEEVEPEAAATLSSTTAGDRDEGVRSAARTIREVGERRSLAIAVDDLHLVDSESLATLALLASDTDGLRLLLVATLDTDAPRSNDPGLSLLLASAAQLVLGALTGEETRSLLSSLFGEVPNLDTVSALARANTQGNVRELMDAAQGLVDRGLAVYAGGTWILASDPDAIGAAISRSTDTARRFEELSPDARDLASALALDRDATMSLVDYAAVAFDGDRARGNRALTELLESGLVTLAEDKCRFVRESHRKAVATSLAPEIKRRIHGRLAERAVAAGASTIYPAFHFFLADNIDAAAAALDAFRDFVDAHPDAAIIRRPIVLDTVQQIICSDANLGDAFRTDHGAGMVLNAVYQGLPERGAPHAAHFLARLSWLTALDEYHAHPELEPGARLGMAFGLAQTRCNDASGRTNPVSAVRRLCQLAIMTAICARFMADPALLSAIPDISPFAVVSPAVALAARHVGAVGMLVRGKDWSAWKAFESIYEDSRGAAGEGMDPVSRLAIERGALGQLCALEAEYGCEKALAHIDALAATMPDLAESCRARYYLARGMTAESDAARRNCELLSVQSGGLQETRIAEVPAHLALHAIAGDVLGLKRALAAITEVAKTRPGWKSRAALAKAHLFRCRGDFAEGLATIENAMAELPADHGDWGPMAALHVALLELSGQRARAVEVGVGSLARARDGDVPCAAIALSLALALAESGDGAAAQEHIALARAALEAAGAGGIRLGHCFEVAARVASLSGDRPAFLEASAACARLYRHGENPMLTARYDALVRADLMTAAHVATAVDQLTVVVGRPQRPEVVVSMSGSSGSSDNDVHADVLALLVERAGALGGFLYARVGNVWSRICGTPGLEPPNDLDASVLERLTEIDDPVTEAMAADDAPTTFSAKTRPLTSSDGCRMVSCLLGETGSQSEHIVGIAVLAVVNDTPVDIPTTSLAAAARALAPRIRTAV